ncbi:energy transducer TonB [Vogesella indigofera]|uniref:Energy transducer TonB n=1 Tax=Vogesella indigofera TaxID=45465 RepID=A0ABT5I046_VOGIN|nr:energy transducer TonB [Vogesella indigofera]MDC7689544.1 energy transducer TonB [Vogesella indigofera]
MTRFTPTPAPPDKSLFHAAILVSLALHLLLLLAVGRHGLPRIPSWQPAALQVTLLATPPAPAPPPLATQLAQHDSEAGSAAPAAKPAPAAVATTTAATSVRATPTPAAPKAESTAVLSRAQSGYTTPPPTPEAAPRSAQDWLSQARQLGSSANAAGGEAQDKARAVFGVSATGVSWARYVEDWRLKIERIGKRNYPAEARAQNLYGSLELAVVIRADGALQEVRLLRSSGHAVLDQAAQNIVRMAAPYAPFPPTLAAEFRSLEVVRKWSFTTANQLSAN